MKLIAMTLGRATGLRLLAGRPPAAGALLSTRVAGIRRLTQAAEGQADSAAKLKRRAARKKGDSGLKAAIGIVGSLGFAGGLVWMFTADEEKVAKVQKQFSSSIFGSLFSWVERQMEEIAAPFSNPSRDNLLPDWPPFPSIPPDTPPLPTLVLDLEDTLVHSEWDRKYGWRHAKRPGVDEFLLEMSKFYETVVFTSNIAGLADPVITSLDKNQAIYHRLYRDCTTYKNGVHMKDLSKMNRDIRHIIIIDDDPRSYQLQPENAIPIKPFTDASDVNDTSLTDLIPFLRALAVEGVKDFRTVLAEYEGKDIAQEYNRKMRERNERMTKEHAKGIGAFARKGFLSTSKLAPAAKS